MKSNFEERVFHPTKRLSDNFTFFTLLDCDVRRFLKDFYKLVIILSWSRDGK